MEKEMSENPITIQHGSRLGASRVVTLMCSDGKTPLTAGHCKEGQVIKYDLKTGLTNIPPRPTQGKE